MAKPEMKIRVNAELGIDEDTADLALKIVNMYCNQKHKRITDETVSHDSDETKMRFEDKFCGCEDCDESVKRNFVCYTGSGKEKQMIFCSTCGRRVKY